MTEQSIIIENEACRLSTACISEIVVCAYREGKDKSWPAWKTERSKYLYTGKITNQNLREILPNEVMIEFDSIDDEAHSFDEVRQEALKWTEKLKEHLTSAGFAFIVSDHEGKSPHMSFIVEGLEKESADIQQQYKKELIRGILETIGFSSDLIEPDYSLCGKHLVALEGREHFKAKYGGKIEKVVFVNEGDNDHVNEKYIQTVKEKKAEFQPIVLSGGLSFGDKFIEFLQKQPLQSGYDRNNVVLKNAMFFLHEKGMKKPESLSICKKIIDNWQESAQSKQAHLKSAERWFDTAVKSENLEADKRKKFNPFEINEWIDKYNIQNLEKYSSEKHGSNEQCIVIERDWGVFDTKNRFYAERIDSKHFLCNHDGKIYIADVVPKGAGDGNARSRKKNDLKYFLENEDGLTIQIVTEKPFANITFYPNSIPALELCQDFADGKFAAKELSEVIMEVRNCIKTLFAFKTDGDREVCVLTVLQSYLKPILESFFYTGVDATKGGGKTTLLEIETLLCRHGMLGGDISAASLPRTVEAWDTTCFLDEIDQSVGSSSNNNSSDNDRTSILRKGQRKNNPYIRCDNNNVPKAYDLSGGHGFSFRGEIEDAIRTRTLLTHIAPSDNRKLPIINAVKPTLLKPYAHSLFFSFFKEIWTINDKHERLRANISLDVSNSEEMTNDSIQKIQDELYAKMTENFNNSTMTLLSELSGRNAELFFDIAKLAELTGYQISDTVIAVMTQKTTVDNFDDDAYKEFLEDELRKAITDEDTKLLDKGDNINCKYVSKSGVYANFSQNLKTLKSLQPISTKKFTALLRDIGFIEGKSIMRERIKETLKVCLVFTKDVCKNLNIDIKGKPLPEDNKGQKTTADYEKH